MKLNVLAATALTFSSKILHLQIGLYSALEPLYVLDST